jgi:hypothetical protein
MLLLEFLNVNASDEVLNIFPGSRCNEYPNIYFRRIDCSIVLTVEISFVSSHQQMYKSAIIGGQIPRVMKDPEFRCKSKSQRAN